MTTKIKPEFWTFQLNETQNWSEDIQKRVNKVYGVYFYNKNEVPYCCEITPYYCCYPMRSYADHDIEDEQEKETLWNDIHEGDCQADEISYFHCSFVDRIKDQKMVNIDINEDEYADEGSYRELVDKVQEHLQGNPVFC